MVRSIWINRVSGGGAADSNGEGFAGFDGGSAREDRRGVAGSEWVYCRRNRGQHVNRLDALNCSNVRVRDGIPIKSNSGSHVYDDISFYKIRGHYQSVVRFVHRCECTLGAVDYIDVVGSKAGDVL